MTRCCFALFTFAAVACGASASPPGTEAAAGGNAGAAGDNANATAGAAGDNADAAAGAAGDNASAGGTTGAAGVGASAASFLPNGNYAASYEVPVPDELSAAASFTIPQVNWSIDGDGVVQIEYDLPVGLVGTGVHVSLAGKLNPATRSAALTGDAGSSDCTLSSSAVTCSERLSGLAPIESDFTVVSEVAAGEFAGPAEQRVEVAMRFSADPIGTLAFDLASAVGGKKN